MSRIVVPVVGTQGESAEELAFGFDRPCCGFYVDHYQVNPDPNDENNGEIAAYNTNGILGEKMDVATIVEFIKKRVSSEIYLKIESLLNRMVLDLDPIEDDKAPGGARSAPLYLK